MARTLLVVLFESVVMLGLGVGTHSRALILTGLAFVGVDTLSGGGLALLLIGAATWLSQRQRHATQQ